MEKTFFRKLGPPFRKPGHLSGKRDPFRETRSALGKPSPLLGSRAPHSGNRVPFLISKRVYRNRSPLKNESPIQETRSPFREAGSQIWETNDAPFLDF